MVDILRSLQRVGLPVETYHYVGFGSYFFHDYRILHHELNVSAMTSIEGDASILARCEFNKPYSAVEVISQMSSDFLPSINRKNKYLIWLDNDFGLTRTVTDDVSTCLSRLSVGSIFFLTIDTELPNELQNATLSKIFEHFSDELQGEMIGGFSSGDFAGSTRDITVRKVIERAIQVGLRGRTGITFKNLLSLYYKDSNRMYTMGGVICDQQLATDLEQGPLMDHEFVVGEFVTDFVEMPRIILTRKERLFLEPFCLGSVTYDGSIGVSDELLQTYKKYYRYLPSFSEIF
jgi:hypothetical protein